MVLTAQDFRNYFKQIVEMIEEEKDYLCELDRKLGDGDHGVTMSIGWQAVNEKLDNELSQEEDCSKVSIVAGKTFLSAVGSSVGPLYATGFMRGAKEIKGQTEVNEEDLVNYWVAFGKGIKERGQAEVGDKTMVDTLEPFFRTLEEEYASSRDFSESFSRAVDAAKAGMESTKDLLSKRGRSSRLGDRSIGAQDPGATSAYLIVSKFQEYLQGELAQAK
ncbi:PTS-dependent dihydroxyacetone kinase, ADP-binding subunit dhaL [Bhargavaea cecembensis DSE10]|uniref:phosphoenolpyruvate--glycerone phosphotransferase n=1 Tax=Bhargavaea cecembensis DSE10 TaxID=1235279 RepID=M7NIQ8_9BACL|nr:dihydroxyacetone kinase subunit DhaL [Bhargavaea cecembensis]EMR07031.1 PTS-dependent dihydroxyacetone kinase, ADP-binding subunit dhaL [Bhargavaea cecembensis DSE10]